MYSNTVTEDLWNALSEVSGQEIEPIMSTWTKQTGFPVLTVRPVSFDPKTSLTVSIQQTRFLADGSEEGNTVLYVSSSLPPLAFASSSHFSALLHSKPHVELATSVRAPTVLFKALVHPDSKPAVQHFSPTPPPICL